MTVLRSASVFCPFCGRALVNCACNIRLTVGPPAPPRMPEPAYLAPDKPLPPLPSLILRGDTHDRVVELEKAVTELQDHMLNHKHQKTEPPPLPAEYLALCRYPYLQDESCKLPAGHLGDHGPRHQCNVDCGLSPDGCVLPVLANPAASCRYSPTRQRTGRPSTGNCTAVPARRPVVAIKEAEIFEEDVDGTPRPCNCPLRWHHRLAAWAHARIECMPFYQWKGLHERLPAWVCESYERVTFEFPCWKCEADRDREYGATMKTDDDVRAKFPPLPFMPGDDDDDEG